ncbi:MAG TPA: helix-turn-helix domain-containing protein [Ktedonobacterales bacterium]
MPISDDDPTCQRLPSPATRPTLPAPAGSAPADDVELSRQEQAFTLYCQGERTTAIADRLGVTPRTVRGWLTAARAQIAGDREHDHRERLVRAIESHRAIASAAWDAYQQERQLERDLLAGKYDHIRRRSARRVRGCAERAERGDHGVAQDHGAGAGCTDVDRDDDTLVEEYERPRHTSQAARFLAVALNAQREVARLEGLYRQVVEPLPPAQIIITRRPDGPENIPPPDEEE